MSVLRRVCLSGPFRLAVIILLLAAGIWAAATIRMETELLPLLPPHLPSVQGMENFEKRFASDREIMVVADPAMPETERGEKFAKLRPALAAIPGVTAVLAPGEEFTEQWPVLAAWAIWNLPPDRFATLLPALKEEAARTRLAEIPDALAGAPDPVELVKLQLDPLRLIDVISSGSQTTSGGTTFAPAFAGEVPPFLIVRTGTPLVDFNLCMALTDAIHGVIARELPGEKRFWLTGRPAFTAEISRQMRSDMMMMMGVAVALICVAFWAFYRTLRPLGWILFFQMLALLAGLVVARFAFGSLNVISMGFASILLGVGMDYSILVYHHFASVHREDAKTWARLRHGIWFSALTTSASFLILAFSSFPGLRQLSALVAAGLLGSALFATWLLGSVLAKKPPVAPPVLDRFSHAGADWVTRHRRFLVGGAFIAAAVASWFIVQKPQLFYTGDMSQFRPAGGEAWRGQEVLFKLDESERDAIYLLRGPSWEQVKMGAHQLALQVSGGKLSPWSYLLPAPDFQVANRQQWPAGTLAGLQSAFTAAGLGEEWSHSTLMLSTALEQAAQGKTDAFRTIQPQLATLASQDAEGCTAVVRLPEAGEHPIPAGGLDAEKLGGVEVFPVSWVTLKDELTKLASHDVNRLGIWMLVALVTLCALAQRSFRLVALNMAALLLALLVLAALLVTTGTQMTPLSLLSVPLLLGLVIDYSLHILMAMEHSDGDLRHTYSHLAAPVVLTGLSSCIGFGAPMLTKQPALQNFGLVMDLGIMSAVAVGLLVLPALHQAWAPRCYTKDWFYRFFYRPEGFGWAIYWAARGRWVIRLISRVFAFFYTLFHPAAVAVVRRNLALLDPKHATWWSALRLYQHQGLNFAEYGCLASRPPEDAMKLLGRREGFEYLAAAQAKGNGCLLVTAHLGFFELGGLVMRQMGHPIVAITLPEPTPELTRWRAEFRGRWGVRTVEVGKDSFSVVEIVRELRAGSFVALLGDRPYDENHVVVDLPHGKTTFATGPVLVALMADCPIVPVACVRDHDGTYRAMAMPPIYPRRLPEGRDATLQHYTQEIANALRPVLLQYPEQWFQFVNVVA